MRFQSATGSVLRGAQAAGVSCLLALLVLAARPAKAQITFQAKNMETQQAAELDLLLDVRGGCEVRVTQAGPFASWAQSDDRLRLSGGRVEPRGSVGIAITHDCPRPPQVREWWWAGSDGEAIGAHKRVPTGKSPYSLYSGDESAWGYAYVRLETPSGTITLNLPDDLGPGDRISGSIALAPAGGSERQKNRAHDDLVTYAMEVAGQDVRLSQPGFTGTVPPEATQVVPVTAWDRDGNLVVATALPAGTGAAEVPLELPFYGQIGRPVQFPGSFDGDFATSSVRVGSLAATLLVESPRKLVAIVPAGFTGATAVTVREGERAAEGPFHCLSLDVTPASKAVKRADQVALRFSLRGLAGLRQPVSVQIVNRTPGLVFLEKGSSETVPIPLDQVGADGAYSFNRGLTAMQDGTFAVEAWVRPAPTAPALQPPTPPEP